MEKCRMGELRKFCSTRGSFIGDKQDERHQKDRADKRSFPSTMKTLLIATLCSVAVGLTSFGQTPIPAPPTSAGTPITTAPTTTAPTGTAPVTAPVTAPATGMTPAAPTDMSPGMPPAVGMTPATAPAMTTPAATVPAATASPAAAVPGGEHKETGNALVDNFVKGGPIMWPILLVSITAIAVVLERVFWWLFRWMRRDPKRIEKVFTAIESGDVAEASRLSRGSRDPVLRMIWNGLNHQHASLQGALQVAAGIEIKRAGRFLVVMDTLVTLAPLLGLLGTITGLMRSFSFLGNEELAVQAVTGGIAEALIATACGLGIAIFALIPFNFFTSRVSNLEFELQTAATNLEVMLEAHNATKRGEMDITAMTK
jgi:biopolymer transport protein ExbB